MANVKISALPAAGALTGTEILPAVQGGVTSGATATQMKTFTSASPTLVTPVLGVATGTSATVTGLLKAYSGTAIPAGGTAGSGVEFSSATHFGVYFGSGAPTLAAAKGSLYLRSDGSTVNDRMYVNSDGSTTWVAVTTAG